MFEKADEYLKDALDKRLKDANLDWERTARTLGWDPEIIEKVKVINGEDGYTLSYSDEDKEAVFDLEYGNGGAPKAAMRIFNRDHGPLAKLMDEAVAEATRKVLNETMVP
jgi:hypothetical protein